MPAIPTVLSSPFVTLFLVIACGLMLGNARVRGISLGAAGVLFAGLVFGHVRHIIPPAVVEQHPEVLSLPRPITELGLLLFVYAVGLQAGPRFVRMFRSRAKAFLTVGLGSVGFAALAAVAAGRLLHLGPGLTTGLFTGALTNTPALAAGRDIVERIAPAEAAEVPVGHGLAYPFSAIFVVVLVQLLPRLMRQSPAEAAASASADPSLFAPPLSRRQYRITNPNIQGMTVAQFHQSGLTRAVISRIKREGVVYPAERDMTLQLHDVVLAVGRDDELKKLTALLGEPADDVSMLDVFGRIASENVAVSAPSVVGTPLGDLLTGQFSDVIVTRVRRQGLELSPDPGLVLEPGDALRVVGNVREVEQFVQKVGAERRRLSETSLLPFALGVCLGALAGMVPIPLLGGVQGRLGLGGGAFLVGLFLGHVRKIGPFQLYVPEAAILFARELGLVVFLAGAGLEAGERFADVLRLAGVQTLVAGACVTLIASLSTVILSIRVLRRNALTVAGTLSGLMTNPPALNAATALAPSDAAPLAFASIYPVATVAKIVLVQIVFLAARWSW